MRVIPGTHKTPALAQRETDSPDNALSRGQTVAADLDEDAAVDLALQAGEMSLHHIWIVHGSNPIRSDEPRIGIGARYVATEVQSSAPSKPLAVLARGRDEFGHFELLDSPAEDQPANAGEVHQHIINRIRSGMMVDRQQHR